MHKRTLPTGILALVAILAASIALGGCGSKSSSSGTKSSGTSTSAPHKKASKAPAY